MQPQRKPSPISVQDDDDDVIIADPLRHSPGKRKGGSDQPSPWPKKRQMFWVEVPPRSKRVPSISVKLEPLSPDDTIQVIATTPAVKEEPDQEIANALAVITNVSCVRFLTFLLGCHSVIDTILALFFFFSVDEPEEI